MARGCVPYSAEHMRDGNEIVRFVVRQIEEFAEGITLLVVDFLGPTPNKCSFFPLLQPVLSESLTLHKETTAHKIILISIKI
jgi:hypothetical protein